MSLTTSFVARFIKLIIVQLISMLIVCSKLFAFTLIPWTSGFSQITDVQFIPETDKVLITEKSGSIFLIDSDGKNKKLVSRLQVNTSSEHGLLAVLPWDKELIVYYSPKDKSETRLSIFQLDLSGQTGKMLSKEKKLLTIAQPYNNHNGGGLIAGKEGEIFLAVGDGGSSGDPRVNGQNPRTLLGSILRIEPNKNSPIGYNIPKGNLSDWIVDARPEIFAMGLRNAWRISLSLKGDLFIADVGQNSVEEINLIPGNVIGSTLLNFGWNIMEGDSCYKINPCKDENYWPPIATYTHEDFGQSITGGYLYEGQEIPDLKNHYLFADFVSGRIGAINLESPDRLLVLMKNSRTNWSTFGRDLHGELYIADFHGKVYKIVR